MNTTTELAPAPRTRFFPELLLVIGLPLLAVFIGGALAVTAYVKGFSPLPEPAAQTAPR